MPRKKNKKQESIDISNTLSKYDLEKIEPLTDTQKNVFKSYKTGNNLVLHGYAGTGKTFISLYLALNEILTSDSGYDRILVVRSVVPSRDIGFLPGTVKEKIGVYEEPYSEICDSLFGRTDGYEILKLRKTLEFTTTSFLRGMTFNNAIVIVDEIQNMTFSELDTIMTRMGENSKIILCGDFRQTDLWRQGDRAGLHKFLAITKKMGSFSYFEFEKSDIVRSNLVKDYIIHKTELEETQNE